MYASISFSILKVYFKKINFILFFSFLQIILFFDIFRLFWCADIKNKFLKIIFFILMYFRAKNILKSNHYRIPKHRVRLGIKPRSLSFIFPCLFFLIIHFLTSNNLLIIIFMILVIKVIFLQYLNKYLIIYFLRPQLSVLKLKYNDYII
jgi:hypothetical protein